MVVAVVVTMVAAVVLAVAVEEAVPVGGGGAAGGGHVAFAYAPQPLINAILFLPFLCECDGGMCVRD